MENEKMDCEELGSGILFCQKIYELKNLARKQKNGGSIY